MAKNWTVGKIILIVWFLFATVFAAYSGWGALKNVIFRQGVQRGALLGQNESITKIIQLSQNCNMVNLFAGEGENRVEIGLVNAECTPAQIKAAEAAAASQATEAVEPAPTPVQPEPVVTPPVEEEAPVVQLAPEEEGSEDLEELTE